MITRHGRQNNPVYATYHANVADVSNLLGRYALSLGQKFPTFRRRVLLSSSGSRDPVIFLGLLDPE